MFYYFGSKARLASTYEAPALKAMCDLIEDLQAENRKGPARQP